MNRRSVSLEERFTQIYTSGLWVTKSEHGKQSRSGHGSIDETTEDVRAWLPRLCSALNIKTFADVPCGDWGWMHSVALDGVEYTGYDIVAPVVAENSRRFPHARFRHLDASQEVVERADLIFCKEMLQHLDNETAGAVISNFKKSGSRFLLTSCACHPAPITNQLRYFSSGGYMPENLDLPPFSLGGTIGTLRLDGQYYTLRSLEPPSDIDALRRALLSSIPSIDFGRVPEFLDRLLPKTSVLTPKFITVGELGDSENRLVVLPLKNGFLDIDRDKNPSITSEQLITLRLVDGYRSIADVLEQSARARSAKADADGDQRTLLLLWLSLELGLLGLPPGSEQARPDTMHRHRLARRTLLAHVRRTPELGLGALAALYDAASAVAAQLRKPGAHLTKTCETLGAMVVLSDPKSGDNIVRLAMTKRVFDLVAATATLPRE
jgi:hypothetical protein